ncbi:hypothetical protein K2173_003470 [Erythroxylum novogranatense]|uniref:GAG-pre-integrase domain-containing protein n=1 Tax=Erythroxylum novogranatense TaxID=1862640 RepID=A0AAV8S8U5_9ROSI|nr:hypothetical protein K2173_003470 [Erythroxylum novogranatense]
MSHLEIERTRREQREASSDRSQNTGAIEDDASTEVSVRIQEKAGSVTLKYPMLTRCNYAAWAIKMEVFMMAQGVWEAIESSETVDNRKDKMALAAIYQSIGEDTLLQLAKEAWIMLKNMNLGVEKVKEVRTRTLYIDVYSGKLTIIVNKLRGLGNTVDDIQFLQITSTIEEFSDLKTKSVDEIIGSLKAHGERLQGFGEKDETVLLTRAEWKGRENAKFSKKEGKDQGSSRGGRGREPDFVMLNETIVPPPSNIGAENSWYLDTGASNHMSGERRVFRELDTSVVGKVRFGDNSMIDICGREIVLFKCKTDEHLILSQVYYLPKLKSNIISLGQLGESGNKIVTEDSVMKIYGRARSLIIMVTIQSNRLYVAKLKLADQVCLMANISNNGWLWHARYGHLNFHSLKQLTDKRMVEGLLKITQVNQFCDGCLIGK